MEISTGLRIPLTHEGEEIGSLRFDPTDVRFAESLYDFLDDLKQAEKDYAARAEELDKNAGADEYGVSTNARAQLALTREMCGYLHEHIDKLFGANTSALVFGESLSLEAIYDFLDGLAPYLDKAQAERVKKYTNRTQRRAALRK